MRNPWYKWYDGDPIGKPRIIEYVVGFYENGKCYDEMRCAPENIGKVMPYLMAQDCKVFAVFGKNEIYELKFERKEKEND